MVLRSLWTWEFLITDITTPCEPHGVQRIVLLSREPHIGGSVVLLPGVQPQFHNHNPTLGLWPTIININPTVARNFREIPHFPLGAKYMLGNPP